MAKRLSTMYIQSPYFYRRRKTHEVKIGDVGVGGNNPYLRAVDDHCRHAQYRGCGGGNQRPL